MIQRISKNFSCDKQELKQLEAICEDTGMNASEVVRQLINKAFIDKKCRQIITNNYFTETAIKRTKGTTSHNVQYENEKKEPISHETGTAVSSNSRLQDTISIKKRIDLNLNAGKNPEKVFEYLTAEQLEAVAEENWNFWTIKELIKIANDNITRNRR